MSSPLTTPHNKSIKGPMKKRQIITLMHKLFYSDINTTNGYVHLLKNDSLNRELFEIFVTNYIHDENLLIYVNSQSAFSCTLNESYEIVKSNYSKNRIKIANKSFTAKIIIEPTGVGVGHVTASTTTL